MSETFFSAAGGGEEVEGIQLLLPAAYDLLFGGISFVLLLLAFWKFILPRAKENLEKRTDSIEGGIARAANQEKEAAALLVQYREQLSDARQEAAQLELRHRQSVKKLCLLLKVKQLKQQKLSNCKPVRLYLLSAVE